MVIVTAQYSQEFWFNKIIQFGMKQSWHNANIENDWTLFQPGLSSSRNGQTVLTAATWRERSRILAFHDSHDPPPSSSRKPTLNVSFVHDVLFRKISAATRHGHRVDLSSSDNVIACIPWSQWLNINQMPFRKIVVIDGSPSVGDP